MKKGKMGRGEGGAPRTCCPEAPESSALPLPLRRYRTSPRRTGHRQTGEKKRGEGSTGRSFTFLL